MYAEKCDLVEYLRSDEESSEEAPVFFNEHSAPEKYWLGLKRSHGSDIEDMFYAGVPQFGGPLDEYRMPRKLSTWILGERVLALNVSTSVPLARAWSMVFNREGI